MKHSMMKNSKLEAFIKKAIKTHGYKYDYSKTGYINSLTKVCIICPEHGEFWQTPSAHIRGNGCPVCANMKRGKKGTLDNFINKAKKAHGDKYDYSKVEYKNANTKVSIICPEHGEFWQLPMAHLNGQGCPKCSGRELSQDEIINKFKEKYCDKYDYSEVEFTKVHSKVKIICPKHGAFYKTPSKHLLGQGCPKCAIENRVKKQFLNTDIFVNRSKILYGDYYDYSLVDYKSMNEKVDIICKKHGIFKQRPYDHLQGHGCPHCGVIVSKCEDEIYDLLSQKLGNNNIIRNDRKVLNGKEIDIYIPSLKVGIEYNGLKWHSEENGKDCKYHLNKMLECNKQGIKLIQIFEDEYLQHKEIVLSKIYHLLKINNSLSKIMARKCIIREIEKEDSKTFLNENHIQGYGKCTVSLGCYYNNKLIGVMSFLDENNSKWNLVRFATDISYNCIGVGGKLFNYFINNYNPLVIKTFADRRWTINTDRNLYTLIGFEEDKILKPDYRYIDSANPKERIHKFNLRKRSIHKKYNLPASYTESQMTKEIGYYKIWDCGLIRYVWKQKSKD